MSGEETQGVITVGNDTTDKVIVEEWFADSFAQLSSVAFADSQ